MPVVTYYIYIRVCKWQVTRTRTLTFDRYAYRIRAQPCFPCANIILYDRLYYSVDREQTAIINNYDLQVQYYEYCRKYLSINLRSHEITQWFFFFLFSLFNQNCQFGTTTAALPIKLMAPIPICICIQLPFTEIHSVAETMFWYCAKHTRTMAHQLPPIIVTHALRSSTSV